MKGLVGFRNVAVFTNVTNGDIGTVGAMYVEVTNNGGSDVLFYPNDFPNGGHPSAGDPSQGIPIQAGTTREIPMLVLNFVASGAVTVVAYQQ